VALLSRAAAIVFGDQNGSRGEGGWVQGSYRERQGTNRVHVCLNQALSVAERDLWFNEGAGDDLANNTRESGELYTQEATDAQQLLADTICEQFPDIAREHEGDNAHAIIVAWNDNGQATAEGMEDLLWKTEQKAYDQWLKDRPSLGRPTTGDAFIDYIAKQK
jgi:hypothetical protein